MKRLTAEEYWEWRVTISDLNIAKLNNKISVLQYREFEKDLEILKLKMSLFKIMNVDKTVLGIENCEKEYGRFKKVLEDRLGISLDNKMIDEITYEIKEVPNN